MGKGHLGEAGDVMVQTHRFTQAGQLESSASGFIDTAGPSNERDQDLIPLPLPSG